MNAEVMYYCISSEDFKQQTHPTEIQIEIRSITPLPWICQSSPPLHNPPVPVVV